MSGEPIISIGGSLSTTECRRLKPGSVFSFLRSTAHLLQHDYGNSVVANKLPLRDNNDAWEAELDNNGLHLCQGAGQTDWKRGGIFRFVTKDETVAVPASFSLGIGQDTVRELALGSVTVVARQVIQYRFNPSDPLHWIDPNTYFFGTGYNTWQILRSTNGYHVGGASGGGFSWDYSVRNLPAGVGEILFTGSISAGFAVGIPPTETWIDSGVDFEMYNITGSTPPFYFPRDQTTIVHYDLRVS